MGGHAALLANGESAGGGGGEGGGGGGSRAPCRPAQPPGLPTAAVGVAAGVTTQYARLMAVHSGPAVAQNRDQLKQARGDRDEIISLLQFLTPLKPIFSIIFMYSLSEEVKVEGPSTQHMTHFQNT